VVDDLNPVLSFTRREVESLLHFVEEEPDPSQVQLQPHDSLEGVLRKAVHLYPHQITKVDGTEETHVSYRLLEVEHVWVALHTMIALFIVFL